MALDRDKLAARLGAANVSNNGDDVVDPAKWAAYVVRLTDALLSRLAPAPSPSLADGEWRDAPKPAAPSPAASPAAWVPSVGDKVEFDARYTENRSGVVVSIDAKEKVVGIVRFGEAPSKPVWQRYFSDVRFLGVANDIERINAGLPATSSERAAAGLTPAESARQEPVAGDSRPASGQVDREGLIAAMDKAVGKWWGDRSDNRRNYEVLADAAIAFMAKAPAFDRAEFNEAQEREAARVAVSRDAGDDFTRGWLARARVSANGGVA